MNDENKITENNDPIVLTINDGENERSWKRSECNDLQLTLVRELEPIARKLVALETEFAAELRNKEYRLKDFVNAGDVVETENVEAE